MYKIFTGDDTNGVLGRHFYFVPHSSLDLTGCVGQFQIGNITKSIMTLVDGEPVEIAFSRRETESLGVGVKLCTLFIYDPQGRKRTIQNDIPVLCTDNVDEVYSELTNTVHFTIGTGVDWELVLNKPRMVLTVNGEEPDDHGNVNVSSEYKPFTQEDVFDMNCNDWEFRKKLAAVWVALGGKVVNDD